MGAFKWIGGLLGWVSGGPIGALIGVILGSVLESGIDTIGQITSGHSPDFQNGGRSGRTFRNGQSGGTGRNGTYSSGTGRTYSQAEQRNSFMVCLLVLSSAVMRADGKFLQSETDYVRNFIRRNFGEQAVSEAMRVFDDLNGKEINVYSVGVQISGNMNYSQRLQLFHYLADLANADGEVCESELSVLQAIAASISITSTDAESILAMFRKTSESAYAVLEISPSATDDEVKCAYRRLAMKYHPDKVSTLGPDVQKAAEEKFRKIQEAYASVKKERGMN